ncbi:hypothetical protein V8G54_028456 [Vigna mungo]|uniref:40S ribosomal protein S29 n=1 Tax=Vigna mungo TaxID=3915 RepID=A0AAQ3MSE5_VIGMU
MGGRRQCQGFSCEFLSYRVFGSKPLPRRRNGTLQRLELSPQELWSWFSYLVGLDAMGAFDVVNHIRVCGNPHGLIRKYGLMCCRQCFRSNAKEIGFIKVDLLLSHVAVLLFVLITYFVVVAVSLRSSSPPYQCYFLALGCSEDVMFEDT